MAPGILVDKDKGSADLLSTTILYGLQSVDTDGPDCAVVELKNYQDQLCSGWTEPGQARG